MVIMSAAESHSDAIWEIFHHVVSSGDTYTFDPSISREEALAYWMASGTYTYVAISESQVVGTYIIKPNHPGLGSHVANASYMVSPSARRLGVGSAMCSHSLEEARRLGFLAMQFNIVASTNSAAISLWEKQGFTIAGTLPKAFRHKTSGLVDALVMHRFL